MKRDEPVEILRARAADALRKDRPRAHVRTLLERLLASAADGSEDARFARRTLAELSLHESPWQAALHIRRVLAETPNDDGAHALLGLSHAVMGNFASAVSAFRRAVALSPSNPWYLHNLGHLLDVALDSPRAALPLLERAHRAEPGQTEVCLSYLHALARSGRQDDALAGARALLRRRPREPEAHALVEWLERGAKGDSPPIAAARSAPRTGKATTETARPEASLLAARIGLDADIARRAGAIQSLYAEHVEIRTEKVRAGVVGAAVVVAAELAGRVLDESTLAASVGVTRPTLRSRALSVRKVLLEHGGHDFRLDD